MARSSISCVNSEYINQAGWCKNCYLIFESDYDEDCMYSSFLYDSKTCLDVYQGQACELCYEIIDCRRCYNLKYSQDCENCSDSWFLKNCIGCKHCFGCVNLRNKEYYWNNTPLTKEQYEEKLSGSNHY